MIYIEDTVLCVGSQCIKNYYLKPPVRSILQNREYLVKRSDDTFTENSTLLSQVSSNNKILLTLEKYHAYKQIL